MRRDHPWIVAPRADARLRTVRAAGRSGRFWPSSGEIRDRSSLSSPQDLQIEAVGAESTRQGWKESAAIGAMWERNGKPIPPWSGNAWILDLQSRKVVWELSEAATTRRARTGGANSRAAFTFRPDPTPPTTLRFLTANTGATRRQEECGRSKVARVRRSSRCRTSSWSCGERPRTGCRRIDVSQPDVASDRLWRCEVRRAEHSRKRASCSPSRPRFEIYAVGEAREDGEFDFGWIINADTRATVWRFTYRDSQPAGGAAKNRVVRPPRVCCPPDDMPRSTPQTTRTIRPNGTRSRRTIPRHGA